MACVATSDVCGLDSWKSQIVSLLDAEKKDEVLCVKSTFLDMGDGLSLKGRFKRFRKARTDGNLDDGEGPEVYEPGNFSSDAAKAVFDGTALKSDSESEETGTKASPTSKTATDSEPETSEGQKSDEESEGHAHEETTPKQDQRAKRIRTTVMMRNLPNNYTRSMLIQLLDSREFAGQYDFLYLPIDFSRKANLGYAFVNFVSEEAVSTFWNVFDGFSSWSFPSSKVCEVSWSGPKQGFKAHVDRYKNSPVMHKSVPDEYKPIIFLNGIRKKFPAPSIRIQHPKKAGKQ
mmetsp:Transcript_60735/g.113535  ORF Transcript_60735/g.113535 Transcript_60735/m.113535 type:complete len:289 (-) Transcript_60735:105-971(-)